MLSFFILHDTKCNLCLAMKRHVSAKHVLSDSGLFSRVLTISAIEFLHSSGSVDELLFAGKERMTFGAYLYFYLFPG